MQIVGLLMVLGSTGFAGFAIDVPAGGPPSDEPLLLAKLVREFKLDNSLFLYGDTLDTNLNPMVFSEAELVKLVAWYDKGCTLITFVQQLTYLYLMRIDQRVPESMTLLRHAKRAYNILVRVVDPHDVITCGVVPYEYSEEDYQTIVRLTT